MATDEKIRRVIQDLANRKQNVTLSEIEWVMGQLARYGTVTQVDNEHQRLYSFEGRRFGVCTHHPGRKQIKAIYVKNFLQAMMEAGWYEN
jgi:hypothetical protein